MNELASGTPARSEPLAASATRMPERPELRAAEVRSRAALAMGLRALLGRRHRLLLVAALLAIVLGVVFTFGPFLAPFRAVLAVLGISEEHALTLLGAAAIYDFVIVQGLWSLLEGLGLMEREQRALDQIETRCATYFNTLDALPFSLGQADNPFLFTGTGAEQGLKQTAAFKMTENIMLDARARRFDPVSNIVERVIGHVTSHSLGLRDAQQLAVRLGILGTFMGIVPALANVGGILNSSALDDTSVQSSLNLVIGALGIAFTTSIAGLAAAILLQMMAGRVRTIENDLIELLERQAARVQTICRRASEDTPLGADIEELRRVLDDHVHFMRRQEKDMIAISSRFGDALSRTENVLSQPIAALEETGQRLGRLLDAQGKAVVSLERMTTSVAQVENRVAAHFEASIRRSAEVQAEELSKMSGVQGEAFRRVIEEIRTGWGREARDGFEALVDRRLGEAAQRLDATADRQLAALQRLSGRLAIAMACAMGALLLLALGASGLVAWSRGWLG